MHIKKEGDMKESIQKINEFVEKYEMSDFTSNPEKMYTFLRGFSQGGKYERLAKAIAFARKMHEGNFREGELLAEEGQKQPSIIHPLRVTCYLLDIVNCDTLTHDEIDIILASAVMHDILEDCKDKITVTDLPVDEETREVVLTLTIDKKEGETKEQTKDRYYNEMRKNPFAIIIKPGDRLDNLSTIFARGIESGIKNLIETKERIIPMLEEAKNTYPRFVSIYVHLKDDLERTLAGFFTLLKSTVNLYSDGDNN